MECVAFVNAEVANVATPAVTVPVPITVTPSLKVTVPVAGAGTVAVKVTETPVIEGFALDV
jgi:hypothetical protein